MKVYKFGGASIADAPRMKELLPIIVEAGSSLVLVVSALGKTTNALENIVRLACEGKKDEAVQAVATLQQQHHAYAQNLLSEQNVPAAIKALDFYFDEIGRGITRADARNFDYCYDQIVCIGELLSTTLFSKFLDQYGLNNTFVDARTVVRSDDTYRDGVVNWEQTNRHAQILMGEPLKNGSIVVTQGFIGSTPTGSSITLGREGSDYSAAIFAAMLGAESVTIWKDVDGFRNADPKQFPDTVKIDALSYNEVIEMAYYGAQIIHPKTIKPLQNNHIPLYVKCFLDSSLQGSVIRDAQPDDQYPPLIVLKQDQVLLQVTTRDFSFITEDSLSNLYAIFHELKIKVNVIQTAAISFVAIIDNREEKIAALVEVLTRDYKVLTNHNVSLLTIRHYDNLILEKLTAGRQILLKQETRKTIQVVIK